MQQPLELENQRWVTLVDPEDDISALTTDIVFSGKEKDLGDLGIGRLFAQNRDPYLDHELGLSFMDGKLVAAKASSLGKHLYPRLYDIHIYVWPLGRILAPMTCQLLLSDGTILEQGLYFHEDDWDLNYKTRYEMSPAGSLWKRLGDSNDTEYRLFAPADPKFLSTLKFSFKSSMEIPIPEKLAS